jgi:hypothetical protein
LTHSHGPVGPEGHMAGHAGPGQTWSAGWVGHVSQTARTPAGRQRRRRGGHGEKQGEVLLDQRLTVSLPVWSIWPEETGSGGTDAGELQPWRRGWRRRRRTRASRVYSGGGEEQGEMADLLDSSASLGEASYGGIGGDQGSGLG